MKFLFAFIIIFAFALPVSFSQELVTVMAVHDGDSYKVKRHDGSVVWVRVWGVDCPEVRSNIIIKDQDAGVEIAIIMRDMLKGKQVIMDTFPGRDKYKRIVAKIQLDTIYVTQYLISNGYGWPVKYNMSTAIYKYLQSLQEEAKLLNLGLWGYEGRKLRPSTFRNKYSVYANKESIAPTENQGN